MADLYINENLIGMRCKQLRKPSEGTYSILALRLKTVRMFVGTDAPVQDIVALIVNQHGRMSEERMIDLILLGDEEDGS